MTNGNVPRKNVSGAELDVVEKRMCHVESICGHFKFVYKLCKHQHVVKGSKKGSVGNANKKLAVLSQPLERAQMATKPGQDPLSDLPVHNP